MSANDEAFVRLTVFLLTFAAIGVAEAVWPWRAIARAPRWQTNIGLSVFNTALLRLSYFVVPALSVLAAWWAERNEWGLLPAIGIDGIAAAIIAFVALDLTVYAQHVAFHHVPVLWRLHRVHHADTEIDVTTGLRFHPAEIIISQAWKIAVVLALGAPVIAVFLFEVVLNAMSMFSHANLRLPSLFERGLRAMVVTPDMHRIHHSTEAREANSNFGFNLSLWDRLFGTYRDTPALPATTMPIGLPSYRGGEPARFLWSMQFPFVRGPAT
jgi:sterol desaturase/sphingolipid hydroxylase (fatty acid hydroxylase superfamily)